MSRWQKKKKKENPYFNTRSTIRSDVTLYSEAIYQDPTAPGSGIPVTIPSSTAPNSSSCTDPGIRVHQNQKTSDSPHSVARKASADGQPPALPVRPPRTKKNMGRNLASEEEVTYDNAGSGGVRATTRPDTECYDSLDEVSHALSSHDTEIQMNGVNEEAESKAEVETQTEA